MSHAHDHSAIPKLAGIRQSLAPAIEAENRETAADSGPRHGPAGRDFSLLAWTLQYWRLLLTATAVFGLAAFAYSFAIPPTYEAAATLILTPADRTPGGQSAAVTNTRTLYESRALAAQVIERFKLNEAPYGFSADAFVRDCLRVTQIRDTNYLRVAVRLPHATLAADAANAVVGLGVELNRQLTVENTTSVARGLMKSQLDEARTNLERRTRDLEEFRRNSRLDLLRKDVEQLTDLRAVITDLEAEIAFERAKLSAAEQQLGSRSRVLDVPRSLTGEGRLLEHSRLAAESGTTGPVRRPPMQSAADALKQSQRSGGTPAAPPQSVESQRPGRTPVAPPSPDAPLALGAQDVFIDPVYEVLEYQAATSRNRLAALQAQREALVKKGAGPLGELYTGEARLDRLKLEHELATKVYRDLVLRYEQARENAVSQSASIQVADPAVVPAGTVAPNRMLIAAVGATIGLLIGITFGLLRMWRHDMASAPLRTA